MPGSNLPKPAPLVASSLRTFNNRPFNILLPAWVCDALVNSLVSSLLTYFVRYIVQPEYSPVSIAAQAVPESTLLIFENVRGHIDSLRQLRHTLHASADTGYVPTQEFVTTSAFGALVLTTDHSQAAFDARRHWKRVQALMSEMTGATADCIDVYNTCELQRVGQRVACVADWRKSL